MCMLAKKLSVGASWKECCGLREVEPSGAYFPKPMAIGTVSTNAMPAGVRKAYGSACSKRSLINLTCNNCCWTVPLSERTRVPQEHRKKGGQEAQALGRSRGGFTTKIHVSTDGLGTGPLRLTLTAGQRHDITQATVLIDGYEYDAVIADRSYDSDDFLVVISANGAVAIIPPRSNRKETREYDAYAYRERHLIECFINKIKHYRRVFSRFDKLASRYLSFLHFVSMLIWLR
jgi:transposase